MKSLIKTAYRVSLYYDSIADVDANRLFVQIKIYDLRTEACIYPLNNYDISS